MRSVGLGRRTLGVVFGGMALAAAAPTQAMTVAPLRDGSGAVVQVQFVGGPFFGPYGYYHPDPADRHYFYEGFDPSVYPQVKQWRGHRRWVRTRHHYVRRRY